MKRYGLADRDALKSLINELRRARGGHSNIRSAHEGIAVIEEEYIELRTEVYKKTRDRDENKMRAEAIQIAAMAIRFVSDLGI